MKLKQIKEFNTTTVTPEIAAKLQALVGLQCMFENEKWTKDGFTMTNDFRYEVYNTEGKISFRTNHSELEKLWADKGFTIKEFGDGLTVINNYLPTYRLKVWETGRAIQYWHHKKGDWKSSYTGDTKTGKLPYTEYYKEHESGYEYPCDQVKLIQFYLDLGFYTIEN